MILFTNKICLWWFLSLLQLESKQEKESHHKTEKTHSLRQGKTQNGELEKLLLQRWVPGITDDETSKDCSNTSSGSSTSNSGGSSSNVLGSLINIPWDCACLDGTDLVDNWGDWWLGSKLERADSTVGSNGGSGCWWLLSHNNGAAKGPQSRSCEQAHTSGRGLGELSTGNHCCELVVRKESWPVGRNR